MTRHLNFAPVTGMILATIDRMADGYTIPPGNWVAVDDEVDGAVVYVDAQGAVQPLPLQPTGHHVFDRGTGTWIDPRTPAEVEADAAGELEAARSAAALSRIDFLLAAEAAGIISREDTKAAAKGEVPPSLAALIAGLPPAAQFEAEVRWAGATLIERLNPLIITWADILGVADEQLDALFGIALPPAEPET